MNRVKMTSKPKTVSAADGDDEHAERWRAVTTRASSADGHFFYGVRTTGVYCRPSCAARKPRRENVEFFATHEAARQAGYRACKRCRPDASVDEEKATAMLVKACRLLTTDEAAQTRDVARAIGLSNSYFQRSFKKQLGITPQQYRRRVLAERGRDALARTGSVTESVYEAGYASSSRFYDGVAQELGMRPSTASAGAAGQTIHYAVTQCSLGQLMIAWTSQGVCQVGFADEPHDLVAQLAQRFPKARREPSQDTDWTRAVVQAVEMATPVDIPIDIRGTAFQERVWRVLRTIPSGETRSYADVAAALGQPTASRAVAGACAANSVAVLIPCHRIVRADGDLSGYRWGVERKRELLRREKKSRAK